ncbi:MAG: glutamate--tRNA ligase [Gammaproteobacteria bacterium]
MTATKTRFAPSPTGRLHLGNIRTALFNWLLARRDQGVFLLRFEDTDLERSAAAFEPGMQQDLHWLGLDWQEGPGAGGDCGPYRQSQRLHLYQEYFDRLESRGLVYPCFCTQQELKLARKAQLASGRPPRYPGTCAHLSGEEVQARLEQGLQPTLRFRVPVDRGVEFDDLVRGRQRFECNDIGDFIVRRSDATPAFFFSNAVDDALMGITHVLRGEDHLANTPRQILLLQALDLPVPEYGHTSMLVGDDGAPLSKRHGSRSVEELREEGFLPGAVVNYLARLGHHYEHEGWLGSDQLAEQFAVSQLGRSPARFEPSQLMHWQKEAVRRISDRGFWDWVRGRTYVEGGRIEDFVPGGEELEFARVVRDNVTLPLDAFVWAGNLYAQRLVYSGEAEGAIRAAGDGFFACALDALETEGGTFKAFAKAVSACAGVKGKQLFMPLRAALTGESHGPEMAHIWPLMGAVRVRRRLESARQLCAA